MMKTQTILLFCCFFWMLLSGSCQNNAPNNKNNMGQNAQLPLPISAHNPMEKMRGLSFVAPPKPFTGTPMMDVKAVHADWIAVIPYAFTRNGTPSVNYKKSGWGWWGERPDGIKTTIDSAHKAGIHVMLKPQVYVPGGWTGSLDYATDAEWQQWETGYEDYLMTFVEIADSMRVDMLCIGTEFKAGVVKREQFWRNLIKKVRQKYKGKLVYAANWDEYPIVPFWDALDAVGINAYFPLVNEVTPSVEALKKAWTPIFKDIKAFHQKVKRPIIFTEWGYLSVDGCAFNSWEIEKRIREVNINHQAQCNAFDAMFGTFWNESWWLGSFLWKWFPEGKGHEGYPERDYTPQGKPAAQVLSKWFQKK